METTLLESVPFRVDVPQLYRRLRVDGDSEEARDLDLLIRQSEAVARPKAYYRPAFIEERDEYSVAIDGVRFTSRVLRVNLQDAYRVFPYVATCGVELEEWAARLDDVLQGYWASVINEMALRVAVQTLENHLTEAFCLSQTARMNPGSLADWPISQQRPLFTLLGNVTEMTGIRLTDSFLMLPIKSVSGIWFPTEVSFESCQLCQRELCPGRRAAYDADLYERRYRQAMV